MGGTNAASVAVPAPPVRAGPVQARSGGVPMPQSCSIAKYPPATRTRPSGSAAIEGAVRACVMMPTFVQSPVAGSQAYALENDSPMLLIPPATSTRPSASPIAANLLRALFRPEVAVHSPVAGSHTAALTPLSLMRSTRPSASRTGSPGLVEPGSFEVSQRGPGSVGRGVAVGFGIAVGLSVSAGVGVTMGRVVSGAGRPGARP